jgi:5-methylcytosine-specific restriction protein B
MSPFGPDCGGRLELRLQVSEAAAMATWGIHNDQTKIDPIADKSVRIGWDPLGDLAKLAPSRDAFKAAIAEKMPQIGEAQIPSSAGTVYRFVHAMQIGDVVVCPDRRTATLNIGVISGPYEFHPESDVHQHWRPVQWIRTGVPRTELSTAAQNEISSATTLFQVTTGEDEIGHLLEVPQAGTEADFSWAGYFPRLTNAFMKFRDDRDALLAKVWAVSDASGRSALFKYLRGDQRLDGSRGPVLDTDPFTLLGSFNRGIKSDARALIAQAYGEEFGVEPPYPQSFPGVPVLNNLNSWFFSFENERGEHEIDALWDLAEAAMNYSADANETTREQLVASFDASPGVGARKLSIALYWIRPDTFASYDSSSTKYLKDEFPELAAQLSLDSKLDGEQFLANTEKFAAWIADPASPFDSIPAFSLAAYNAQVTLPPAPVDPAVPGPAPVVESYNLESIRDDGCFITEAELEPMLERLRSKKNIVLQGPPGTGKTWLGRRLGWALCEERNSKRVQVVQFHPSLTYEDFVRGYRPTTTTGLDLADGPFLDMCTEAAADPDHNYVLVVEEINRGNPAQIFGELLTLIEADKRTPEQAMRLAYPRSKDEVFFVPSNLHLIGTMNVADRSLAIVDMALRRRFAFLELKPAFGDDWVEHVSGLGYDRDRLETFGKRLIELNETITQDHALGRQYCVGHSFVTPATDLDPKGPDTDGWWRRVIETDVRPLLEEYWFDRPDLANEACKTLLAP